MLTIASTASAALVATSTAVAASAVAAAALCEFDQSYVWVKESSSDYAPLRG